jgi:hypothetical protein
MSSDPRFSSFHRPRGETAFNQVYCTGVGPVMQIDFWQADHRNVTGQNIDVPMEKLYGLTIYNDGPGSIQFSTNTFRGSMAAGMMLNAGENIKLDTPHHFGPLYERMNICAPTASGASVRIMGVF